MTSSVGSALTIDSSFKGMLSESDVTSTRWPEFYAASSQATKKKSRVSEATPAPVSEINFSVPHQKPIQPSPVPVSPLEIETGAPTPAPVNPFKGQKSYFAHSPLFLIVFNGSGTARFTLTALNQNVAISMRVASGCVAGALAFRGADNIYNLFSECCRDKYAKHLPGCQAVDTALFGSVAVFFVLKAILTEEIPGKPLAVALATEFSQKTISMVFNGGVHKDLLFNGLLFLLSWVNFSVLAYNAEKTSDTAIDSTIAGCLGIIGLLSLKAKFMPNPKPGDTPVTNNPSATNPV